MVDYSALVMKYLSLGNEEISSNHALHNRLARMERTLLITIGDQSYSILLMDGKLTLIERHQRGARADITLQIDPDTMNDILMKNITPMTAYMQNRLIISASLRDLFLIRKIYQEI